MTLCKKLSILVIAALATACAPVGIHLKPMENLQMTVLGGTAVSNSWVLRPGHDAHRQLVAWLDANQYGWSTYLVTTPGAGLLADADSGFRLQFVDDTVLLCVRQQGCQYKKIPPEDYAFLLRSQPPGAAN